MYPKGHMEIVGVSHSLAMMMMDKPVSKKSDKAEKTQEADDRKKIQELKKRDAEVRRHEQAHLRAASGLEASGPNYTYEIGPDNKRYAVAGEVDIDTSQEKDPQDTIEKAQQIVKAALAPADPSSADRRVAADARRMEREARAELAKQEQESKTIYSASGDKNQLHSSNATIEVFA